VDAVSSKNSVYFDRVNTFASGTMGEAG